MRGGGGVTENDDVLGWEGGGGLLPSWTSIVFFFLKTILKTVKIKGATFAPNNDNDDPMPVITLKYILENNPFIEIDVEEEDSDMDTDI